MGSSSARAQQVIEQRHEAVGAGGVEVVMSRRDEDITRWRYFFHSLVG
jgi:hypothetical protein